MDKQLENILNKFAQSKWDLIKSVSQNFLNTQSNHNKTMLIKAIEQADFECGSCGCEFDELYKKALQLLK